MRAVSRPNAMPLHDLEAAPADSGGHVYAVRSNGERVCCSAAASQPLSSPSSPVTRSVQSFHSRARRYCWQSRRCRVDQTFFLVSQLDFDLGRRSLNQSHWMSTFAFTPFLHSPL